MGKVIFNSDDFGYNKAVNYGILDAYTDGILTSTTVMAGMPGFGHAAMLSQQFPGLGVGVHLTLTCGRPVRTGLQTLVDDTGDFRKLSAYHDGYAVDLDELYCEWDAQIAKVLKSGIRPTHLDSHHHIHTFLKHPEVVVALARKYNLPVRGNLELPKDIKHTQYFETMFDQVGYDAAEREIKDLEAYLDDLIEKLHRYDSTEVMCHCAYLDQMLREGSSFALPRINQTAFMIASPFAQRIREDAAIECINYRNL